MLLVRCLHIFSKFMRPDSTLTLKMIEKSKPVYKNQKLL